MEGQTQKKIQIRWHDGYEKIFNINQHRIGSDMLWMERIDADDEFKFIHVPLEKVREFRSNIQL